MSKLLSFGRLILICLSIKHFVLAKDEMCETPQYLEHGRMGIVHCSFTTSIYSIHWYDTDDVTDVDPTIEVDGSGTERGRGYTSGEFKIHTDGSLIINNVSVHHEAKYTVTKFKSSSEHPFIQIIEVRVKVTPEISHPVIEGCSIQHESCYRLLGEVEHLSCHIEGARPSVDLSWHVLTNTGQYPVPYTTRNNTNGITQSSFVTAIHPFKYYQNIALFVCEAKEEIPVLEKNQTLVLVQKQLRYENINYVDIPLENGQSVNLTCSRNSINLLVWEKSNEEVDEFEAIAYWISIGRLDYKSVSRNKEINEDGSLQINEVQVYDEGFYRCFCNNNTDVNAAFHLLVYVKPTPEFPVVDGCDMDRYCTLDMEREGTLTCSVYGIRPTIQLEFTLFHHDITSDQISFYDAKTQTINDGGTADIIHTTEYKVHGLNIDRVTVECRSVKVQDDGLFDLSTTFDILFARSDVKPTAENTSNPGYLIPIIIIIVFVLMIVLVVAVFGLIRKRRKSSEQDVTTSEERDIELTENQILLDESRVFEKKQTFIEQLKTTYATFYNAVKPVPYEKEKLYSIDSVFVEGGIAWLEHSEGDSEIWKPIRSYQEILTDPRLQSKRRIIEGGPGYGKSTLTLQMIHDWCSRNQNSVIGNYEILILLKLRQLGGIPSFLEAIKTFLLPKNSKLQSKEIEAILDSSGTVMMLLDGFDEYPDAENQTDILEILQSNLYPNFDVILTTRLSDLPNDLAAETKRLRLTGFGSDAQELYLKKAVTQGNVAASEKIQNVLYENPVFRDLCQIPLFFVMYAHLSQRSKELQTCTSATSFFRYMVSSLHHHLKRKYKDKNVNEVDTSVEKDHDLLDKLAFNSLSGKERKTCWERGDIRSLVGEELLKQCLRIGILQEEDLTEFHDNPGTKAHEHVQYVTIIRFYHELFCEWYAAHYVAEIIQQLSDNVEDQFYDILDSLDPAKYQYVFRFACGLDVKAADHIIRYLTGLVDRSELVIMCILERKGSVHQIIDVLEDLCSQPIQIKSTNMKILNRSILQLLEIAESEKVNIQSVAINETFDSVDNSHDAILLTFDLQLPVLTTLQELRIDQSGKEFQENDLDELFTYINKCTGLKILKFSGCILPETIKNEKVKYVTTKGVKILWYPMISWFILDISSGNWVDKKRVYQLTGSEYETKVTKLRDMHQKEKNEPAASSILE